MHLRMEMLEGSRLKRLQRRNDDDNSNYTAAIAHSQGRRLFSNCSRTVLQRQQTPWSHCLASARPRLEEEGDARKVLTKRAAAADSYTLDGVDFIGMEILTVGGKV